MIRSRPSHWQATQTQSLERSQQHSPARWSRRWQRLEALKARPRARCLALFDFGDPIQTAQIDALDCAKEANLDEADYEHEVYQTAIHEAGHVLAAWTQGLDVECAGLSFDDDIDGRTLIIPSARLTDNDGVDKLLESCRSVEKRIRISFAGPIAEGRFAGFLLNSKAAHNDFQRGVLLLRELADSPAEREVNGDYLHAQTEKLVRRYWKPINQLAAELVTHGEICSEQIEAVLGPRRQEFESRSSLGELHHLQKHCEPSKGM